MDESESKNEKPKENRRFDPELLKEGLRCDLDQYEFLTECSKTGVEGIKEWNVWRKKNFVKDILLEGADLCGMNLHNVDLSDYGGIAREPTVCLKGASLLRANLECTRLNGADLQHADLMDTDLIGAELNGTILKNASLQGARLNGRYMMYQFYRRGACFDGAQLEGTDFQRAIVDESTSFWDCKLNRETDFREVALGSIQMEQKNKQLLEYNIRRMNWEEWYNGQHWSLRWLVRKFWKISDYGISAKQIIKTFFKWALVFALFYYAWGFIDYYLVGIKDYPGIVSDLFVLEDKQESVSCWLVPFRAVYFSIVTMTTLGFGDMYANAHSFLRGLLGHTLLALQVILGYVLLGALVTRFAVLFTAGGPAGKFANEKKNRNKTTEKIKN